MEKRLHITTSILLRGMIAVTFLVNVASGQTWTFTSGPYRPHEVKDVSLSKPGSNQTIWAVDAETLKYSTNGGASWLVTSGVMVNPIVVAVSPVDWYCFKVRRIGTLSTFTSMIYI